MRVAVYSFERYDATCLIPALSECVGKDNVKLVPVRLVAETAELANGCEAVCIFVNDKADAPCLEVLARGGVKYLLLRSAGFNHVDLEVAANLGISVRRVPAYSPYAVAEMAIALLLGVVRKIPKAYNRVREHNFSINGLEGFDIRGKTIGIVGTGKIGTITAKILAGFSPARLLGYDVFQSDEAKALGVEYCSMEEILTQSDIISLHLPLLPDTYHIIGRENIAKMKKGVVIINVSRGALVDAVALQEALKSGQVGGLAMDVYENEQSYFFKDCSDQVLTDDVLANLLTFPNVIITAHQAFLTREALETIASTTVHNLKDAIKGAPSPNECKNKCPNECKKK
mmetsp:Transcript_76401/g.111891  ORF Transcript_76401/g.111891 Transcript_76401/m.111891 type:complete len:343 (+) Transcript_76401:123-1151(+)